MKVHNMDVGCIDHQKIWYNNVSTHLSQPSFGTLILPHRNCMIQSNKISEDVLTVTFDQMCFNKCFFITIFFFVMARYLGTNLFSITSQQTCK